MRETNPHMAGTFAGAMWDLRHQLRRLVRTIVWAARGGHGEPPQ